MMRVIEMPQTSTLSLSEEDEIEIYYRILGERQFIRTMKETNVRIASNVFEICYRDGYGEIRKPQNGTFIFHKSYKINSFHLDYPRYLFQYRKYYIRIYLKKRFRC